MTKETIRRIDVLIGSVLCFLLTLHRRIVDLARGPDTVAPPLQKILFLKLIEQGATVLAAPAIRDAVARVGRENVYFMVFRENRPILDILGLVPPENVIEVRHDQLARFVADVLRALSRIRSEGIDTVIDMEFLARAPAILAYLTGAARRVGLHRFTSEGPYRGDLMTHRVQHNPYLHTSVAYALLVGALDLDPSDLPLSKVDAPRPDDATRARFTPSEAERARVRGLLERALPTRDLSRQRIVLLNPNTGDLLPIRMWQKERFIELGRRILRDNSNAVIVITGAPSERDGAEAVCKAIGSERAASVAGATTLRDVLVLYTLADVLVTNDSGPGHFASMTDIDNVVLFGPETPQLFGPLGERRHVVWAELACSPCVSPYNHRFSPCTNNRCMQAITVDTVYERVARALAGRPPLAQESLPTEERSPPA
ncbi:MAG: glycosyltransferase family 9 protein [Polyangiaceae bacterium]